MTAEELYKLLDDNDIRYEVVEIFEGVRILNIKVNEEEDES